MRRGALIAGALSISLAAALRLVLAPLRILSADEAYYLCAARRGSSAWPIDDHPPLLGAYLALADHVVPGPIELRVRFVAIVLQVVTALAVARLASRLDPTDGAAKASERWAFAAVLATWGLLPMAGGLLATPDAPLLAALAWLIALLAEPSAPRGELGLRASLIVLAALAVASKASALPFALVIAVVQLSREPDRGRGVAIAIGALLATPLALPSLRAQLDHVLGRGSMVAAPQVGPLLAMGAFVAGQLVLIGPAVVLVAVASLRRMRELRAPAGLSLATLLVIVAALGSALVSGRPPEPNWTAPAVLLLFAVTAVGITRLSHAKRFLVLALTIAPTLVVLGLWSMRESPLPASDDPLARVLRVDAERPYARAPMRPEPGYARPAWRCVYENDCVEIDALSTR